MLWGHTLRSPHAARPRRLDRHRAGACAPRRPRRAHARRRARAKTYGLEFPDQPVLAIDRVRYHGEPVALVAAEHPEQARRAAEAIVVEYEQLAARRRHGAGDRAGAAPPGPADDGPRLPRRPAAERRPHIVIRHGDPDVEGDVTVRASTRSAPRTRRSSAPSRGSPSRTARAASTSTSPPSGSTSTATRSRPASRSRPSRCGSTSPASAARSAAARTSRSRSTPRCSPSTRTGR